MSSDIFSRLPKQKIPQKDACWEAFERELKDLEFSPEELDVLVKKLYPLFQAGWNLRGRADAKAIKGNVPSYLVAKVASLKSPASHALVRVPGPRA